VQRLDRLAPLPDAMQGRWVAVDDPGETLLVAGGEVICFGSAVAYDYKLVEVVDDALTVSLKVTDPAAEDEFQRANVTGLVITPEGEFHAWNVKFASQFQRG
jgi:hypothetical protein